MQARNHARCDSYSLLFPSFRHHISIRLDIDAPKALSILVW